MLSALAPNSAASTAASAGPMPGTPASSSTEAARMRLTDPNCLSSALRRFSPSPGMPSSWLVVIAFAGTFSHFCMARALLYADATVVVPMDFLRVPLTAAAGWLIFGERLDIFTMLGAALILTGNLLNLKPAAPARAGT